MTPFFFGPNTRRLFGVYDPARGANDASPRGVVICYPWGSEYIYAHRSLRQLAIRLSESGIETLRFDYFGTGDSAGEMTDANLAGWQNDIEIAIGELSELAGTNRISLIGLRLGANLAASVAAKRIDKVDTLILWDPIFSGRMYLEEFGLVYEEGEERLIAQVSQRPAEVGGGHEISGFPLTHSMARELVSLELTEDLAEISANTFVLSSQSSRYRSLRYMADQMSERRFELEFLEDTAAWIERPQNIGTIPVKVISRIVDWMGRCK